MDLYGLKQSSPVSSSWCLIFSSSPFWLATIKQSYRCFTCRNELNRNVWCKTCSHVRLYRQLSGRHGRPDINCRSWSFDNELSGCYRTESNAISRSVSQILSSLDHAAESKSPGPQMCYHCSVIGHQTGVLDHLLSYAFADVESGIKIYAHAHAFQF